MTPLTFPARPINGGPLETAPPKDGLWLYEPKFNGWRALIHVPTGAMWNRHGQPLSISAEFTKALAELKAIQPCMSVLRDLPCEGSGEEGVREPRPEELEWADCEALERRHNRGRGSLVLLDLPALQMPLEQRGYVMRSCFCPAIDHCAAKDTMYSVPQFTDGPSIYAEYKQYNRHLGIEFYEGVVAKKFDSHYPIQLLTSSREFPHWIKHRWRG